jgi:hypothetical protein
MDYWREPLNIEINPNFSVVSVIYLVQMGLPLGDIKPTSSVVMDKMEYELNTCGYETILFIYEYIENIAVFFI